jgi:hypothetical protein
LSWIRSFCFRLFGFRNNIYCHRVNSQLQSSALRQTPNLEHQVPVFMSPSNRVSQLYPQAPGSLSVAFYDSQGYGGGFLTRLHMGQFCIHCHEI